MNRKHSMFELGSLALAALGALLIASAGVAEEVTAPVSPSATVAPAEPAAPAGPAFSVSTTYASRYSFQGLDYSDGRPVLQPTVTASLLGFGAGLWGNIDQTRREINEVDATLQREFEAPRISGNIGYAYLHYPHRVDWAPTHEAYLDVAFDAPLTPSLSMHWDVAAGSGRYWTLGLSRDVKYHDTTLGLSTKLYAHEHYYDMSGIPALETSASLARSFGGLMLQPAVSRLWAWPNDDFRDGLAISPGWVVSLTVAPD